MEQITPQIEEQAKQLYIDDDFESFIELFFSGIYTCKDGIEFETWTNGGVNMVHYLHIFDDSYFIQLKQLACEFDVDEEIDLHRQDERYRNNFRIRESVADFESYQNYLIKIVLLIN